MQRWWHALIMDHWEKKWSQNGSTLEPFWKTVPLWRMEPGVEPFCQICQKNVGTKIVAPVELSYVPWNGSRGRIVLAPLFLSVVHCHKYSGINAHLEQEVSFRQWLPGQWVAQSLMTMLKHVHLARPQTLWTYLVAYCFIWAKVHLQLHTFHGKDIQIVGGQLTHRVEQVVLIILLDYQTLEAGSCSSKKDWILTEKPEAGALWLCYEGITNNLNLTGFEKVIIR